MLRRYSKARTVASGSVNGDVLNNSNPTSVEVHEKRLNELSKTIEESQKKSEQVSFKLKF